MQIILSATLPNASGEGAAKSMDLAQPGSEDSFMVQMDQMLQENQETQSVESSATMEAGKTCSDSSDAISGRTRQSPSQKITDRIQNQTLHSIGSSIYQEEGNSDAIESMPVENEISDAELNQLATAAIPDDCQAEFVCESERPDQLISTSTPLPMYWVDFSTEKLSHSLDVNRQTIDGENEAESTELLIADTPENLSMIDSAADTSSAGFLTAVQELSAAPSSESSEGSTGNFKRLANTDSQKDSGIYADSEGSGTENGKGFANTHPSTNSGVSADMEKADAKSMRQINETDQPKDSGVYTDSEKPEAESMKLFAGGDHSKDSVASAGSAKANTDNLMQQIESDPLRDSAESMNSKESANLKETAIFETIRQKPLPIKEEVVLKDSFESKLQQTQSDREPTSKSALNTAKDGSDNPELTVSSPDDSISGKNSAHSTVAKKSERIAPAPAVSENTADSLADHNQANHESNARSGSQSRLETGQTSAYGKPQPSRAENWQEIQVMTVSNAAQSSETVAAASIATESSSKYQSRDFIQKLADQIQIQVRDGKEEIRIQLKPDQLGRIEIKAETTLSGVMARITTESAAVKSYLENNLQLLQQTLLDLGLRLDRIQIVAQNGMDAQFSSGYGAHFGQAGTGRHGHESSGETEMSGLITMDSTDEIALDTATRLAMNQNGRFYTVA
jgi:flagellar hook-length control protein FliK